MRAAPNSTYYIKVENARQRTKKTGRVISQCVGLGSDMGDLVAKGVAEQVGARPSTELDSEESEEEEK